MQQRIELLRLADDLLDELCRLHPMSYRPQLIWKRLRVTAGIAYYKQGAIALSSIVLQSEQAVRETLLHEYAHLLAVHRHGVRAGGHGRAWRTAMADLGLEPKVHHCFEVQRNTPRQKVTYLCLSCGKKIERARRLPMRRKYQHAKCGGAIKLVSIEKAA